MSVHVVKAGEDLWSIANRYHVSISTIIRVNGIPQNSVIVPGLALYIPDGQLANRHYQIQAGESLWEISQRFNTPIENIYTANPGIDPEHLYIGQEINIPSPNKLRIETLGFIVPYNPSAFIASLDTFSDQLTYLAIVAYSFTDEGFAYILLEDREIIAQSKRRRIRPLLMIRNFRNENFDRDLVGMVLQNPIYRNNLIASLVNLVSSRGYAGVSIDFEFIPPPQRNNFIVFLTELKSALGSLILHVNVHAKTEDIPTNPIIGAYDYQRIGEVADIVAVMTIDYGYPTGPPDPVSPAWWVAEVIRYTITQIDRVKLQIALPLYGYEKSVPTNLTKALSLLAAQNLALTTQSPIQFDIPAQSPWYQYWINQQKQVVWFEDIRSYIAKYRLIDLYQLRGATYWQLSLPFPQNWNYMANHISVIK